MERIVDDAASAADEGAVDDGQRDGPFLLMRLIPSPRGMKDLFHFAGYEWHDVMGRLQKMRYAMVEAQENHASDEALKKAGLPYFFALSQLIGYDLVLLHGPLLGHRPIENMERKARGRDDDENDDGSALVSVTYDSLISEYAVVAMVLAQYMKRHEQKQIMKLLVDTLGAIPTQILSRRLREANFEQDSLEKLTELNKLIRTYAQAKQMRNPPSVSYALSRRFSDHTDRFLELGSRYMATYCATQARRMFQLACLAIGKAKAAQQEATPPDKMNEEELKKANVLLMSAGATGQTELDRHETAIYIDHTHGNFNPRSKFGDLRKQASTLAVAYLEEAFRSGPHGADTLAKATSEYGAEKDGSASESEDTGVEWHSYVDKEFLDALEAWQTEQPLQSTNYRLANAPWTITRSLIAFARLSVHPLATSEQKETLMRRLADAGIPEEELRECLSSKDTPPQHWLDRAGCMSPAWDLSSNGKEARTKINAITSLFFRVRDLISSRITGSNSTMLSRDNPHIPETFSLEMELDAPVPQSGHNVMLFDHWYSQSKTSADDWIQEGTVPVDFVAWAPASSIVNPSIWLSRYTDEEWLRLGLTREQLTALGFGSGLLIFNDSILTRTWKPRRAEALFGLPRH